MFHRLNNFFYTISNYDMLTLCVIQHFADAKLCWFPELFIAMVRFLVCLCVIEHYTGIVACALCVLRFVSIVFGEHIVASFGLLISPNLCRYQFMLVG